MKNIERGSIKHLIVLIIAIAVFGMILYPIFDLIYCKLITNLEFVYNFHKYIIQPISFAFISGTVFWVVEKNRNDK